MKVVSIASQKGGVGKTTTAISLSAGLVKQGKKILLIDLDSQANASKVLMSNYQELRNSDTVYQAISKQEPLPVHTSKISNLDIVPSHILISNTDVELASALDHREARLKRQLDQIKDQYDYVLIDCPPSLGWLTLNAFTASDKVMVMVSPGYFELESIVQIGKTVEDVKAFFNPSFSLLGFLFTMSDPTVNSRTSLQLIRQTYANLVLKTVIPRNTDIRDAHFERKDIYSYNPDAPSALAYQKLIREVFV